MTIQSHIPSRRERARHLPALGCALAVTFVVVYGAYLRLDALVGKYGPFERPGWLVWTGERVAATRDQIVPRGWFWNKEPQPYVGGDPVNYLRFAREMTSFYQAHVREPVFLATTRAIFPLVDGQDVAVSFASALGSTLAIVGTFLLGWVLRSPLIGLAAAWLVAIEGELVSWAPDGWRDDTFTAAVVFSAWALVWYHRRRSWAAAATLGVVAAIATLTRITSLTFLLPAGALLCLGGQPAARRDNLRKLAVAFGVAAVLVGPYLLNCYRVMGDPFYAINAHTRFYRSSEGLPAQARMNAVAYTVDKFRRAPVAEFDTAVRGLFVFPFESKFRGFPTFPAWFGPALAALSAAGLFAWLWTPAGRLLLVLLFSSLAPYMLTWRLRGGGEWRFTMHAYPLYLLAAVAAAALVIAGTRRFISARLRGEALDRVFYRRVAVQIVAGLSLVLAGWGWSYYGPALVAREALLSGLDASVAAGSGDRVFFVDGWSRPTTAGAVTSRFATRPDPVLRIPLPERRPYALALRVDPLPQPEGAAPVPLEVWLGSTRLGTLDLVLDPNRVGRYVMTIPAELAGAGLTRLVLKGPAPRPAGDLAGVHSGLDRSQPVAFRLWYARLTPE